jgi:DNA polymerase
MKKQVGTVTLRFLREQAASCRACSLWKDATQTVFGEGPTRAVLMLVGEQPGDAEDVSGRPFVGPAGQLLARALSEAGIDRRQVYLTNVVKHFKFEPRGKRRIHKKPRASEVEACRPWIDAELALVRPRLVMCLGATAAQALLGRGFKVTEHRGQKLSAQFAPIVMATVHPSSILREGDAVQRRAAFKSFVDDLQSAVRALEP